jgi:hypothetical protein
MINFRTFEFSSIDPVRLGHDNIDILKEEMTRKIFMHIGLSSILGALNFWLMLASTTSFWMVWMFLGIINVVEVIILIKSLADVQDEVKEIHQRIDDFLADTLSPGQVASFDKVVSCKFVIEADPAVALLKRGVSKTMFLEIESQDAGGSENVA